MAQEFTLAPLGDGGGVGFPRVVLPHVPVPAQPPVGPPSPTTILPTAVLQLVEPSGSHVAWLSGAHGVSWRRELDGPGSLQFQLQRTDPVLSLLGWDRRVRVWLDGEVVFCSLVEPREDRTIDQAEERGETVTVTGRGVLAVLAQGTVDPIRLALQPVQDSVRFNFGHPDFDDSGWGAPKILRRLDEAYALGETTPGPYWGMPLDEWWDLAARVIGPHQASILTAPTGKWYLRKSFFLAEQTTVQFDFSSDGPATVFLDGQVLKTTGMPEQGMTDIHTAVVEISAGWHVLGVEVTNRVWKFTSANPTGFLLAGWDGRPWEGNVVVRTDATWKMLAYPKTTPGWTATRILRWLLQKWAARGGPSITRTFTDLVDTAGRTLPVIPDETFQCGRSLLDAVMQLAENHLDVHMAPSGRLLSVWVKGTRGKSRTLTLSNTGANPCLRGLQHRTEPPIASRVLARWEGGWISREVDRSWYREMHVQLPNTLTEEQAERTADDLLDLFAQERVEFSAQVHPRTAAQRPFTGYTEGDWLYLPNRAGAPQRVRVLTLSGSVDDNGLVSFGLEAGDRVKHNQERMDAMLRRMLPGTIGGRTEVAEPDRFLRGIAEKKPAVTEARGFEITGLLSEATDPVSNILRPTARWCFVRWVADLKTPGSSSSVFAILVNDGPVGWLTIPAGERSATLTSMIYAGPGDRVQMEMLSAGAGARGLTVTPIYRVG
jgi:hypothetical protein